MTRNILLFFVFTGILAQGKTNRSRKKIREMLAIRTNSKRKLGKVSKSLRTRVTQGCPKNCSGKGACSGGSCICYPNYTGNDCSKETVPIPATKCSNSCSGHGDCLWSWSEKTSFCRCYDMYSGSSCSESHCKENCDKNARCTENGCMCIEGYTGTACEVKICVGGCFNGKQCFNGVCKCPNSLSVIHNFASKPVEDTIVDDMLNNISHTADFVANLFINGRRVNGGTDKDTVDCTEGATVCPNSCSGHGVCRSKKCDCTRGFIGEDCSQRTCGACENGICLNDSFCVCKSGYGGFPCKKLCPNLCSGNGVCNSSGICECDEFFTGNDCSKVTCPQNCNGHGACNSKGFCKCQTPYQGASCQDKGCSDRCVNGYCSDGRCVCEQGYQGTTCEEEICLRNCNSHGTCEIRSSGSYCVCNEDYTGKYCGTRLVEHTSTDNSVVVKKENPASEENGPIYYTN